MQFHQEFIEKIIIDLYNLIENNSFITKNGKPYAAILYQALKGKSIEETTQIWSGVNTANKDRNHIAHAEINLLTQKPVAEELYKSVFGENDEPIKALYRKYKYCLFVNAIPCPMCMQAILHSQIFEVYYFVDTEQEISKNLVKEINEEIRIKLASGNKREIRLPYTVERLPYDEDLKLATQIKNYYI